MTCSGGVCVPTTAEAILNVHDLEAMLASGRVKITTTGPGVQARNIRVDAPFQWSAATTLTLDAFRSIEVNRKVTVAGGGGVSLTTSDGGHDGYFICNDSGRIVFKNLSSALTINGTPYALVDSVASLASAIAANPSGAFALANNYNAKKDGTYTSSPIATVFTGSFNGLGNTISNLSINDSTEGDYVGLFSKAAGNSTFADIRLVNESVQGGSESTVGGIVGVSGYGTIAYSVTSGTVSGGQPHSIVGGLAGGSDNVIGSGSAATVSGGTYVGGLVGTGGAISDSWATGNVSGSNDYDGYVGGLVGYESDSDIKHSWASGQVSATGVDTAGGLVGGIQGFESIERSHATGAVTCQYFCGGLLGSFSDDDGPDKVLLSWATGNVTNLSTAAGRRRVASWARPMGAMGARL